MPKDTPEFQEPHVAATAQVHFKVSVILRNTQVRRHGGGVNTKQGGAGMSEARALESAWKRKKFRKMKLKIFQRFLMC